MTSYASPLTSARATAVLDFTTPHVLRNVREYKAAVAEIDRLIDAGADERPRASEERLEFLSR